VDPQTHDRCPPTPDASPAGTGTASPGRIVLALVTLTAVLAAAAPGLFLVGTALAKRPHYQFFPLVLLGVGWLVWSRVRRLGVLESGAATLTWTGLGASLLALLAAQAAWSPSLGGVGLMLLTASCVYGLGGRGLAVVLAPVWLLLWFLVPMPFGWDRQLVQALQGVTTRGSGRLLDLAGVEHVVCGNVFETSSGQLLVEEACSGIQSLFVVLAGAGFVAVWRRRPWWHAVVLLAAAVGWVLAGNSARAAGLVIAFENGLDLLHGWRHEAVGLAVFVVVMGLVLSTDSLLSFFSTPAAAGASEPAESGEATRLCFGRPSWLSQPLAVPIFVAAAAVQVPFVFLDKPEPRGVVQAFEDNLKQLPADLLPQRWQSWERSDFRTETRSLGNEFGANSRTWHWVLPQGQAVLSADFVFPEWHDLAICYRCNGWQLEEARLAEVAGWPVIVERFSRAGSRYGYLWYTEFDGNGRPVWPPRAGVGQRIERRLQLVARTWLGWGEEAAGEENPLRSVCQVQVFVEAYSPLSAKDQEAALALLLEAVVKIRDLATSHQPHAGP
jgi:exosortase